MAFDWGSLGGLIESVGKGVGAVVQSGNGQGSIIPDGELRIEMDNARRNKNTQTLLLVGGGILLLLMLKRK